jgi:hypothetical protein
MSRKSALPQSRRHLMIFDEDWEFLDSQYGMYSASKIGVGTAVKMLVHQRVMQIKARATELFDSRQAPSMPSQDVLVEGESTND